MDVSSSLLKEALQARVVDLSLSIPSARKDQMVFFGIVFNVVEGAYLFWEGGGNVAMFRNDCCKRAYRFFCTCFFDYTAERYDTACFQEWLQFCKYTREQSNSQNNTQYDNVVIVCWNQVILFVSWKLTLLFSIFTSPFILCWKEAENRFLFFDMIDYGFFKGV